MDNETIYKDDFFSIVKREVNGLIRYWLYNACGDLAYGNKQMLRDGCIAINQPSEGVACVNYKDERWFYINQSGQLLNDKPFYKASDFNNGFANVSPGSYDNCILDHNGRVFIKKDTSLLLLPNNYDGGFFIDKKHVVLSQIRFWGDSYYDRECYEGDYYDGFDDKEESFFLFNEDLNPILWKTDLEPKGCNIVNFESLESGPFDWCLILKDSKCFNDAFDDEIYDPEDESCYSNFRRSLDELDVNSYDYAIKFCLYDLNTNQVLFKVKWSDTEHNFKNEYSLSTIGANCIRVNNYVLYYHYKQYEYTQDLLFFKNGIHIRGKEIVHIQEDDNILIMRNIKELRQNDYYGCVDFEGREIIPFVYNKINYQREQLYALLNVGKRIVDDDLRYYEDADEDENMYIEHPDFILDKSGDFLYGWQSVHNNMKIECRDGKYGVVNNGHEILIPFVYDKLFYWNDKALVFAEEKPNKTIRDGYYDVYGIIDSNQNIIVPCKFNRFYFDQSTSCCVFPCESWYSNYNVIINSKLNTVCNDEYGDIVELEGFHEIYLPFDFDVSIFISNEGKMGLIHKDLSIITPPTFEHIKRLNIKGYYLGMDSVGEGLDRDFFYHCINSLNGSVSQFYEHVECNNQLSKLGFFKVERWRNYGLIDTSFNEILKCEYYDLNIWDKNQNYIFLSKGDSFAPYCGLSDLKGNIIIPCKYREIQILDNGYFIVSDNSKKYLLSQDGVQIIGGYEVIKQLHNGDYVVGDEYKSIISNNLKTILGGERKYIGIYETGANCLKYAINKGTNERKNIKYGLINNNGIILRKANLSYIGEFSGDTAIFNDYGKKIARIIQYEDTRPDGMTDVIDEKEFLVRGGKFGIINNQGEVIVDPVYSYIFPKQNGYHVVCKIIDGKKKYGIIDETGQIIIKCTYSYIQNIDNNLFVFAVGGKWGNSGLMGEKLTINLTHKQYLNDATWGIANINGDILYEPFANYMSPISENMVVFRSAKQYGVIDLVSNTKNITKYNYLSVLKEGLCVAGINERFNDDTFIIVHPTKYGYLDKNLMQVIPFKFYSASEFNRGRAKVEEYETHDEYIIDKNGKILESLVSNNDYYDPYDNYDYDRDTWDALTDGQYGDYPGPGFDDYDSMGF